MFKGFSSPTNTKHNDLFLRAVWVEMRPKKSPVGFHLIAVADLGIVTSYDQLHYAGAL